MRRHGELLTCGTWLERLPFFQRYDPPLPAAHHRHERLRDLRVEHRPRLVLHVAQRTLRRPGAAMEAPRAQRVVAVAHLYQLARVVALAIEMRPRISLTARQHVVLVRDHRRHVQLRLTHENDARALDRMTADDIPLLVRW